MLVVFFFYFSLNLPVIVLMKFFCWLGGVGFYFKYRFDQTEISLWCFFRFIVMFWKDHPDKIFRVLLEKKYWVRWATSEGMIISIKNALIVKRKNHSEKELNFYSFFFVGLIFGFNNLIFITVISGVKLFFSPFLDFSLKIFLENIW